MAYYLHKIIPAKTRYKTYNCEFLAIVKVFKIWQYYLKDYKHKVFILTDHNNFYYLIDIKNLSSCQVC